MLVKYNIWYTFVFSTKIYSLMVSHSDIYLGMMDPIALGILLQLLHQGF